MLQLVKTRQLENGLFGFNGHPPLGVNATELDNEEAELYQRGFNWHPPLGVNATCIVVLVAVAL